VHFLIEQRLNINRLCIVDSTALKAPARADMLRLATRFKVPCTAFLFDVPLETCVARDMARKRSIGRPLVERQYQLFEQAKHSIHQEGFGQVYVLREQDVDKVRIEILFRPVQPLTNSSGADLRRYTPRTAHVAVARDETPPSPVTATPIPPGNAQKGEAN